LAWWLDVLADFQVQYVAVASALLMAALFMRRTKETLLALALLTVHGAALVPLVSQMVPVAAAPAPVLAGSSAMKLVSFNLNFNNHQTAATIDFLRREDADVVTLMEVTENWRRALEQLKDIYPYRFYGPVCRCSDDPPHGDAMLSKRPWREVQAERSPLTGRPFAVWARFASAPSDIVVVGVHLINPLFHPLRHQLAEATHLAAVVRRHAGPLVVTGDFNMTPFSARYAVMLREAGLRRADGGIIASWPALLTPFGLPLDHILINAKVGDAVMQAGPRLGSDHLAMIAALGLNKR